MSSLKFTLKPLLSCLSLVVIVVMLVDLQIQPINPKDKSASIGEFSAGRAFQQLEHLIAEELPHSVDSKVNRLVEKRLVELLRDMGYQEEIQDENYCENFNYGRVKCTRVRNIIVKREATQKNIKISDEGAKTAILLSAHYDSVPASPGGSDAGAAVATLLETARLLSQLDTVKNDVIFLFNEGEEFGLTGAKAFMERHPLAKTIKLAINVEARGTTGQSVMFETGENSGWLVEHYFATTPSPLSSSLFYEVYKFLPNDTDLSVFKQHGLQGLNFAHAQLLPHYHTPLDNLENLNLGSLQHHGDNVWGVLKSIVNQDLTTTANGNLVYSDILSTFGIHWQETTSANIVLILCILLCALIALIYSRKKISLKKIILAAFVLLFTLIVSMVTAWLVQLAAQHFSSTQQPWRANTLPMMIALWAFVISIGLFFAKYLLKTYKCLEIFIGQLLLFTLLAVASSLFMAGISFLFIIPSIVGCSLLIIGLFFKQQFKHISWMTFMLCGLSIILMLLYIPLIKVLEIMVSYSMSMAMGLFLGFVIIGMTPLVALLPECNQGFNRLIAAGVLTSILFLMMTTQQVPFSKNMPQGLNIYYVQEAQSARVLTGSEWQYPSQQLLMAFKSSTLKVALPWVKWRSYTGQIEHQNLKPLGFKIIDNTINRPHAVLENNITKDLNNSLKNDLQINANQNKTITLKIEDNSNDLMEIRLYIPLGAGISSINIGHNQFKILGRKNFRNGFYEYICRGISCAEQAINFKVNSLNKTKILMVKVISGLPNGLKDKAKKRHESAVPHQAGDQSFVISEVEI